MPRLPRCSPRGRLALAAALAAAMTFAVTAGPATAASAATGAAPVPSSLRSPVRPMPDGMRLAVDVWTTRGVTPARGCRPSSKTDRYWRANASTGGIKNNPNYSHRDTLEQTRLRLRVRRSPRHRRLVRDRDRRSWAAG